jgi:hypothetical protein
MTLLATTCLIVTYCWAKSSVYLGPVATFSYYTILTLPFTLWFDVFVVDEPVQITILYLLGAVILLIAFTCITVMD